MFGYILEGAVRTRLGNGPIQMDAQGRMFHEPRGILHTHFAIVSDTEPAGVLIVMPGEGGPAEAASAPKPARCGP